MDYTAVIFCAHLVVVKCEVFIFTTTTSTREIQLCARPATQLTCSPLLPADFTRQSIAHARKSKRKGSRVCTDSVRLRESALEVDCVRKKSLAAQGTRTVYGVVALAMTRVEL